MKKLLLTICLFLSIEVNAFAATTWEQTSFRFRNDDGSETWTGLDLSNNELTIVTQNANSDPVLAVANTANT